MTDKHNSSEPTLEISIMSNYASRTNKDYTISLRSAHDLEQLSQNPAFIAAAEYLNPENVDSLIKNNSLKPKNSGDIKTLCNFCDAVKNNKPLGKLNDIDDIIIAIYDTLDSLPKARNSEIMLGRFSAEQRKLFDNLSKLSGCLGIDRSNGAKPVAGITG
jgi:hypothetical protein